MTRTSEQLISDYLRRLDRELEGLPRARRREVVQEISEHIEEARVEADGNGEAATLNLLERLGDPSEIAAEARARFGVRTEKAGVLEVAAIILLLVGGLFFGIGWLVGVALLWSSGVWTTHDKLVGTFIFPGGLAAPLYLFLFWAAGGSGESCIGPVGPQMKTVCTGGTSDLERIGWIVVFVGLVVGNIATAIYLGRRMRIRSALAVPA
jgi:uncharacterized membrane protein